MVTSDTPVNLTNVAAAAVDASNNIIYFNAQHLSQEDRLSVWTHNDRVHMYHVKEDKWTELPGCGRERFGLAVIRGYLTAVGGRNKNQPSNSLDSLISYDSGKWIKHFPAMPSKCVSPIVVTTPDHKYAVVLARGCTEILDCTTMQWSQVCGHPVLDPSSAAADDTQILLFGVDGYAATCKTNDLISSHQKPTVSQEDGKAGDVWQGLALPYLPVAYSSPAILCGQLMAIGGVDNSYEANADHPNCFGDKTIYQFNRVTEFWMCIGRMQLDRQSCVVVVLGDQLLVAGGTGIIGSMTQASHSIEQATVSRIVEE